jgi:nucleoid DNA-binding protein
MNYRKTVTEIARRLPHYTQREVAEVLDVMRDLWLDELSQSGKTIALFDLGELSIEVQQMRISSAIRKTMANHRPGVTQPEKLRRIYGRFRPSPRLRQVIATRFKEGQIE